MIHSSLKLTDERQEILLETAKNLAPHAHLIIHRWGKAYHEIDRTIDRSALYEMEQMYRAYFEILRGEMDRKPFFDRISAGARRLCQMQVSFESLILSFHLIEESCLPYIKKIYLDKERLVEAMTAVDYMCHSCFSAIASSYFHEKYGKAVRPPKHGKRPTQLSLDHKLTHRELQVFKQIVGGYKNREIADLLLISIKTVEHHRASLMRKLGLRNTVDLIKFAIRNQWSEQ